MARAEAATQITFDFTYGLVSGEVIQFADGRWPGIVGAGIAVSEEGFDLVEPHLRAAAPSWTSDHRYGVFELKAPAREELARRLMAELRRSRKQTQRLRSLGHWLPSWSNGWTSGNQSASWASRVCPSPFAEVGGVHFKVSSAMSLVVQVRCASRRGWG